MKLWNFLARFFRKQANRNSQPEKVNYLLKRLAADTEKMVLYNPSLLLHSPMQRTLLRDQLVQLIDQAKKTLDEVNRIPLR